VNKISIFVRFCRPHTIIATTFQVAGLFVIASDIQALDIGDLALLLLTLIASLSANIYIVGLNQLTDIEIDRVNKPNLPLPAGDLSVKQGWWIVGLVGALAVAVAISQNAILLLTVLISMIIGSAYSLPPLRLKSIPLLAAFSVAFVRGFVTNAGILLHFHRELQPGTEIPWILVTGLSVFFFGFGLVIALYKDIPDLLGDRKYGIRTFTVRFGPERVFNTGRLVLTAFYLVPIIASIALLPGLDGIVLLVSHLFIVGLFWTRSRSVDVTDPAAVTRFYMFLWSLFYAEYILLAMASIAGSDLLL
jgi:homogentisate phytyltransferase/homogentisate geranylgeranyltransferase